MLKKLAFAFVMTGALSGCAGKQPPLKTVEKVELSRYQGVWYEIANYPTRFQRGCIATQATYSLKENGDVDVLNQCRMERMDGELKMAHGTAKVVDRESNAKLKVTFFWPFYGSYWIIDLDPDYRWAVVGHPGRDWLWILSRTPVMDEAVYEGILSRLPEKGYDPSKLVRTRQPVSVGTPESGRQD